jgi:shikimate kinase
MERTWILVGMMGAGKSAVGRALADLSGRVFQDTDTLLQNRLGRSIPQLFERFGEETFREHETSLLRSLEQGPCVLATGGGIACRPENWELMRSLGVTIYLRASLDTLKSRLEASKKRRPLLEVEDWERRIEDLLSARLPFYEQADMAIDVDDRSIEAIAEDILLKISERC